MALNSSGKTNGIDARGDCTTFSLQASARTVATLPLLLEENSNQDWLVKRYPGRDMARVAETRLGNGRGDGFESSLN
jgi:hypothetical protein